MIKVLMGKNGAELQIQGTELVKRSTETGEMNTKTQKWAQDLKVKTGNMVLPQDMEAQTWFKFQSQCKQWYAEVEHLMCTSQAMLPSVVSPEAENDLHLLFSFF